MSIVSRGDKLNSVIVNYVFYLVYFNYLFNDPFWEFYNKTVEYRVSFNYIGCRIKFLNGVYNRLLCEAPVFFKVVLLTLIISLFKGRKIRIFINMNNDFYYLMGALVFQRFN